MHFIFLKFRFPLFFIIFTIFGSSNTQDTCYTPTRALGRCVPFNECSFVTQQYERFENNVPPVFIDFLRRSRCFNNNNMEMVHICCQSSYIPTTTVKTTTTTTIKSYSSNAEYQSRLNPRGLAELDNNLCGKQRTHRVANGNETELGEFPWMALLRYNSTSQPFQCGGSLITNRYVMTAAHCMVGLLHKLIGVRLGEHKIGSNRDCGFSGPKIVCLPPAEDFGIERQIPHRGYSKTTLTNDVGLLRLDRNAIYKIHITPICLPTSLMASKPLSSEYMIAGWGVTENNSTSKVLLKASVADRSRSVCQKTFRQLRVTQNHICAGGLDKTDSCEGDSGGPLFNLADFQGVPRFVQFGIVSYGTVVCKSQISYPAIYANVVDLLPWIIDNIVSYY